MNIMFELLKRTFLPEPVKKVETVQQIEEAPIIRWKVLIPERPTLLEFNEAWKVIFEYYPNECTINSVDQDDLNSGFSVTTPSGGHHHGGFGYHTDNPPKGVDLYYDGYGCSWGTCKEGRYYFIDRKTGLPCRWVEAKSKEIIRRYISNEHKQSKKLFLNQLT